MVAKGAQDVVLAEADAKKLRQIADEGMWQTITRTAPQNAPKLQELFTKAAALKG